MNAILRAIRGIPVVGGSLADIITEIGGLNTKAVTAQQTAEQTAQGVVDGWAGAGTSTGAVFDTMQAIKTAIEAGYTVDTITSSTTWTRPAGLASDVTAVAIGSGQNGTAGSATSYNSGTANEYWTNGGDGGKGGGFIAQSFSPSEIPSSVSCVIGTNGGEVLFGALMSTTRGVGNMGVSQLGFAQSSSVAADGGAGGATRTVYASHTSYDGYSGNRSVVSAGGAGGAKGTSSSGPGGSGAPGGSPPSGASVKCGAGGGGGGGGGAIQSNALYYGGPGGAGGFPGGGGGGGGAGATRSTGSNPGNPGAGGLGGGGVLWLIYKVVA